MDDDLKAMLKKYMKAARHAMEAIEKDKEDDKQSCDCNYQWKKVEDEVPDNARVVLVSHWDRVCGDYSFPIKGYYLAENEIFYTTEYHRALATHVDIWCEFPTTPDWAL